MKYICERRCRVMDKVNIADLLVQLYADYRNLTEKYGVYIEGSYSTAVAEAILYLNQVKEEGAE
jgi:hypothetical protein